MWPRMRAVYTWKRLEPLAQMAVSILRAADWDVRCPQMPAGRSAAGKVSTSGGAADQGTCQACRQRVMATNCVKDGAAESTLLGAEAEGLLCSALPRHFLGPVRQSLTAAKASPRGTSTKCCPAVPLALFLVPAVTCHSVRRPSTPKHRQCQTCSWLLQRDLLPTWQQLLMRQGQWLQGRGSQIDSHSLPALSLSPHIQRQEWSSKPGQGLNSTVALACQGRLENSTLPPPHRCIQFLSLFITPSCTGPASRVGGRSRGRSGSWFLE